MCTELKSVLESRWISASDTRRLYGFKKSGAVILTGTDITDQKVAKIMKEAARHFNAEYHGNSKEMIEALREFRHLCKAENIEFNFAEEN